MRELRDQIGKISADSLKHFNNRKVVIYNKINLIGEIMNIAMTRMSSRGQVVIPLEMREDIQEGEKLLLIKNETQIIMKKATTTDKIFEEDVEFARRTEEAMRRIEGGKGIKRDFDEFIEEMKKW